jgi:kynureninase
MDENGTRTNDSGWTNKPQSLRLRGRSLFLTSLFIELIDLFCFAFFRHFERYRDFSTPVQKEQARGRSLMQARTEPAHTYSYG